MKKNRGVSDARNLTNGPGKLTKAFGIDKRYDGLDLTKDELRPFLTISGTRMRASPTPRIGGEKVVLGSSHKSSRATIQRARH